MATGKIKIGVDFDNTIVNYDFLFHKIALEKELIPDSVPKNKTAVRDYLRKIGKEAEWTLMQGEAYGKRILEAAPYDGVLEFFRECTARGSQLFIISHKTRHPFLGEQVDLHEWARKWLDTHGFTQYVPQEKIFFELTKEEKIARVNELQCNYFIDDLPEFLSLTGFGPEVKLVLFDPAKIHPPSERFACANSWKDVETCTLIDAIASCLLSIAGFNDAFTAQRITGGRNNKVWKISIADKNLLLKAYFFSEQDKRDRLNAEYQFTEYACGAGSKSLPAAYAKDEQSRSALYDFIEGRKLSAGEAGAREAETAAEFLKEINSAKGSAQLANASEACFSISQHLHTVSRRIKRLEESESADSEFLAFVQELRQDFELYSANITQECASAEIDMDSEIDNSQRIISPSDFGFHNALLTPQNKIIFLDFEYSGWDDPAKTVCDFFCQPDVPVPKEYFDSFAKNVFEDDYEGIKRSRLLLPLYEIKWCCIMLNEFLSAERARREYAKSGSVDDAARRLQFQRTVEYYRNKKLEK